MELDRQLMDFISGRSTEQIFIIEAPPRHGKSEFISKYFPAWYLCVHPEQRVILTSYEAGFARSWGRKARDIVDEYGKEWFGVDVSYQTSAAADWEIAKYYGGMVTAGAGGPLTGRGANLLIVDDPLKNDEEALSQVRRDRLWDWWQSTASTRLEPGGKAIVMATRWHKEDLTGRLLEAAESGEGMPVKRLHLPAIAEDDDQLGRAPGEALWPQRWPIEGLEKRRDATDPYWWNALYQQRPSKHGRTEWPAEYFGEHIWAERFNGPFEMSAIAIDPSKGKNAKRGDYAAVVFVGVKGGRLWVDSWIDRKPVDRIVATAVQMYRDWNPDAVALESNMWQELIAPEFDRYTTEQRQPPLPIALVDNRVNKEVRIGRLGAYLARHQLLFADTKSNRLLVKQLEEWPLGDHDDGPDALEMAIRQLQVQAAEPMAGHDRWESF